MTKDPVKRAAIYARYREKHRFREALRNSQNSHGRQGYVACLATEEELRQSFTGRCHSCGKFESECAQKLHMDHDHKTGCFRGWLCPGCNMALGLLQDKFQRIIQLLAYLVKPSI